MRATGKEGEESALVFLKKKGYRVLETNYRTPAGEIDIIARDRGTLVFIEVKARTSTAFGLPFEAVHARKREKMKKVALSYMQKMHREVPARFDVMSIIFEQGGKRIEHIQDAFEI